MQLLPAGVSGRTQPSTHFSQMRRDSHSAAADGGEPRLKVLVIVAELESIGDVTPLIVTVPADSVVTVPAAEEELDDLTMGAAASPTHRLLLRIMTLLGATYRPRRRLAYSHAGGTTETPGVRCFTSGWRKTQCSSCSDHCHSRTESAACSGAWMATQLLLTGAAVAQCNGITAERCAAQASRWTVAVPGRLRC